MGADKGSSRLVAPDNRLVAFVPGPAIFTCLAADGYAVTVNYAAAAAESTATVQAITQAGGTAQDCAGNVADLQAGAQLKRLPRR